MILPKGFRSIPGRYSVAEWDNVHILTPSMGSHSVLSMSEYRPDSRAISGHRHSSKVDLTSCSSS
jgi:hypothetical protein